MARPAGGRRITPAPVLSDEPDASGWLRAGASLVTASGDKLLGGTQRRLLLGRADLVRRPARHPPARALRADKLTLAALERLAGLGVPVVADIGSGLLVPAAVGGHPGRNSVP